MNQIHINICVLVIGQGNTQTAGYKSIWVTVGYFWPQEGVKTP